MQGRIPTIIPHNYKRSTTMPPKANSADKSEDEKLLIAVLSQWDPLPPVDNHKLGATLGIKPGTAAVRWCRFKARLFRNDENKAAGDDVTVEQATAADDNPGRHTVGDSSSVGRVGVIIEKQPAGKKRGRKQQAVKEVSDEPPAQRKRNNKSIARSLNTATSKPGMSRGKKSNKDRGELNGLDEVVKQENVFEHGLGWLEIGERGIEQQGDELDGWQLGHED
ncbi:hypothetical protein NHQ30_005049 [Ciborinia camelliae]|nr:hypothetical protein NHQ30_005049 [Ciborinia camelliae]